VVRPTGRSGELDLTEVTFYLARRLAFFLLILWGVTIMTFVLSHVVPGDPALLAAGPGADREQVEQIRQAEGLDRPLLEQYLHYLQNLSRLDLGKSILTRVPVSQELSSRLPATIELVAVSFVVYLCIGIPLAVRAATTRSRVVDLLIRTFATSAHAVPSFVLAIWLQLLFYRQLGWLPSTGRLTLSLDRPPTVTGLYLIDSLFVLRIDIFADALVHLVLPVTALVFALMVTAVRVTRATLLTELAKDYVRMLRLKGLPESLVIRRHVLRNALIPILTLVGVQFGYVVGGTLLVETVFAWPGIGLYAFRSIVSLDYAPVMGVVMITTAIFVFMNFVIDMLYPIIDPRIRLWGEVR
jgi:peptide/nickel transport system permease protein